MSPADLQAWLGRTQVARDVITPRLIRSFGAALSPHLVDIDSSVPLGLRSFR
jgi:hypothetical protein